jgi:membrane protein YqaA with SNARE-associated domain
MLGIFRAMSERDKEKVGRLAIALPLATVCGGMIGYALGVAIASQDAQTWAVFGIVTMVAVSHIWILRQLWKERRKKT